jgi:hypothetical protein
MRADWGGEWRVKLEEPSKPDTSILKENELWMRYRLIAAMRI